VCAIRLDADYVNLKWRCAAGANVLLCHSSRFSRNERGSVISEVISTAPCTGIYVQDLGPGAWSQPKFVPPRLQILLQDQVLVL
jgi:hypothetical protein